MDKLSKAGENPWLACANVQVRLGTREDWALWMLGMKHSGATVRKVPVTMAPSRSVYLFPVCLGVVSARQTDWEHICTPHSSTEASPDTEEQAGLLAAPCPRAKFPALLGTRGRALLWQGERPGRVGKRSAPSPCCRTQQLPTGEGSQAELT